MNTQYTPVTSFSATLYPMGEAEDALATSPKAPYDGGPKKRETDPLGRVSQVLTTHIS